MTVPSFEDYLKSLAAVEPQGAVAEPEALDLCVKATATIALLDPLDEQSLAAAVQADPDILPVLAAAANLSQERFKTWLQARFETAGWITLGRSRPDDLVAALDEDFALIELLTLQAQREWTWADVLARMMSTRQRAGSAIQQGRDLEDEVELVIKSVGLDFVPRTQFEGSNGRTAPADFAIPTNGDDALIAIAVKGFHSTGSKLGDAAREIEEMALVRKPTQFIFAIVDGQGWIRRRNDLRKIHGLWGSNRIDGLFNRASLGDFETALRGAARRLDLA